MMEKRIKKNYLSYFSWISSIVKVWLLIAVIGTTACVYDSGQPCGENQVLGKGGCICANETVLDVETRQCFPCGQDEEFDNGQCVCVEGYGRVALTGECVPTPPGLGDECTDLDPSCLDPFTCHLYNVTDGYCTSENCVSTGDCFGEFACDLTTTPSYCQRPPTGQGASCAGPDDCLDYEADYCMMSQTPFVCLVQNCNTNPDCFEGWTCCLLSVLGLPNLCVPQGSCPTD